MVLLAALLRLPLAVLLTVLLERPLLRRLLLGLLQLAELPERLLLRPLLGVTCCCDVALRALPS